VTRDPRQLDLFMSDMGKRPARTARCRAVVERPCGPLPDPESLEVSHKARADHGTERLGGQRSSLPNVHDCYDQANLCLVMWNGSDDHAARSCLLRTADAWLQLAFELDKRP
jgi:hypothetical protein